MERQGGVHHDIKIVNRGEGGDSVAINEGELNLVQREGGLSVWG